MITYSNNDKLHANPPHIYDIGKYIIFVALCHFLKLNHNLLEFQEIGRLKT